MIQNSMEEFYMQLRVTVWTSERLLTKFYLLVKSTSSEKTWHKLISKIYKNAHIHFMNIVTAWTQCNDWLTGVRSVSCTWEDGWLRPRPQHCTLISRARGLPCTQESLTVHRDLSPLGNQTRLQRRFTKPGATTGSVHLTKGGLPSSRVILIGQR